MRTHFYLQAATDTGVQAQGAGSSMAGGAGVNAVALQDVMRSAATVRRIDGAQDGASVREWMSKPGQDESPRMPQVPLWLLSCAQAGGR
eukprot:scaffold27996_cov21-Tisochrysis_lutea.AAC.1